MNVKFDGKTAGAIVAACAAAAVAVSIGALFGSWWGLLTAGGLILLDRIL